ncbi:MAG: Unknown protein [uncultured Sulfurovum sp.]|uniref:beta-lactamase n=1 Tax=uncultured Sulfurovum sp. TaxID=269237 RepID=A0A6S6TTN8_9BACT|nr:MAG: Unknown protein [uncultured Sulfurovum sp.]
MKKIVYFVLFMLTWTSATVIELSDSNYKEKIKEHSQILLLFSAPWCGACKNMQPIYQKASSDNQSIVFAEINTDDNQEVSASYEINSLPTLVMLENGKELRRTVGSLEMNELNLFVSPQKMVNAYVEKCDAGDAEACLAIGQHYEEGELLGKDYVKALKFYEQSCALKNAEGCMYLAYMYDEPIGVKQNYKKAIKYYTQGCDGSNMVACRFLGYLYDEGLGTQKNYKKAHELYIKACNHEDEYACNNLGFMYSEGNGVAKDLKKALAFYTLSCKFGHNPACKESVNLKNK